MVTDREAGTATLEWRELLSQRTEIIRASDFEGYFDASKVTSLTVLAALPVLMGSLRRFRGYSDSRAVLVSLALLAPSWLLLRLILSYWGSEDWEDEVTIPTYAEQPLASTVRPLSEFYEAVGTPGALRTFVARHLARPEIE